MGAWGELIEEIYIEQQQCADYPGCAHNLRELIAILKNLDGSFRGTQSQPLSLLTSWLICRGRTEILKQPLTDIAAEMETEPTDLWRLLLRPVCGASPANRLVREPG